MDNLSFFSSCGTENFKKHMQSNQDYKCFIYLLYSLQNCSLVHNKLLQQSIIFDEEIMWVACFRQANKHIFSSKKSIQMCCSDSLYFSLCLARFFEWMMTPAVIFLKWLRPCHTATTYIFHTFQVWNFNCSWNMRDILNLCVSWVPHLSMGKNVRREFC